MSSSSLARSSMLALVPPIAEHAVADHDRREHVFERRELRQQVIELKDHAEVFVAEHVAAAGGRLSMRLPSKWISPASGASSVPSRCSSVLLPQPLWPTMATNSPGCDGEIDALEDGDFELAFAVALDEAAARRGWRMRRCGLRSGGIDACGRGDARSSRNAAEAFATSRLVSASPSPVLLHYVLCLLIAQGLHRMQPGGAQGGQHAGQHGDQHGADHHARRS